MLIINEPENWHDVQCYRCKTIMKAHPLSNMNADYYAQCELHQIKCAHESDGLIYTSNPPQNKCKKCGEFYR